MAQWTAEQREVAVGLLRAGGTIADVHRRTDIPKPTLSRWASEAGIDVPGAERVQEAATATRLAWAQRRGQLVDRIGSVVETLLDRIESADDDSDPRGNATAFGILVDKAQLLSGGVTSRSEQLSAERAREELAEMVDELEERRRAKDGTTGG